MGIRGSELPTDANSVLLSPGQLMTHYLDQCLFVAHTLFQGLPGER
jgi:hypothetical protein